MVKPKLRALSIEALKDGYLVVDPYQISKEIFVSDYGLFLLSLMDGTRDIDQIRLEFTKKTGLLITREEIERFIHSLKENLMLEDENFIRAFEKRKEKLLRNNIREPSHVNVCYPGNPEECKEFLVLGEKEKRISPVGIICPHMDLRVAKDVYWEAYGRLNEEKELVVILGVSHYMHQMPFSVFPGHFQTPFGILETDTSLVENLKALYPFDVTHDVLSYEKEHSIEFQTLYVKLLYPNAKVLAMIISYGDKEFLKSAADTFLRALKGKEEKVLFVSSIDLSHVGRRFGDMVSYDTSYRDMKYLELIEKMQGEEAFDLLVSDNNSTRIDGQFTNLFFYYVLKNLGVKQGKLLDYKFHHDIEWDSRVSYASMAFM